MTDISKYRNKPNIDKMSDKDFDRFVESEKNRIQNKQSKKYKLIEEYISLNEELKVLCYKDCIKANNGDFSESRAYENFRLALQIGKELAAIRNELSDLYE